jgi:hypothetical protein
MITRLTVLLLFSILHSPVFAEWVKLGSENGVTAYADIEGIEKNGGIRRMQHLSTLAQPRANSTGQYYSSVKIKSEYDCQKKMSRILSIGIYSGTMGGGNLLSKIDGENSKWSNVPSNRDSFLRLACGTL